MKGRFVKPSSIQLFGPQSLQCTVLETPFITKTNAVPGLRSMIELAKMRETPKTLKTILCPKSDTVGGPKITAKKMAKLDIEPEPPGVTERDALPPFATLPRLLKLRSPAG